MVKKELINAISEKTGLKKYESENFIETFIDVIMDALENGQEVKLNGLGKFVVSESKARICNNPKDKNSKIEVPAKKVPKFKYSKNIKNLVNGVVIE